MFVSPFFGKMMLLDNEVMLSERDEAHYHEMLVHVPMAYLPAARRVLIIGGGDGGTLTQVLKHPVRSLSRSLLPTFVCRVWFGAAACVLQWCAHSPPVCPPV